nr:hypothetical protein [Tanacetum cinerariifolium]
WNLSTLIASSLACNVLSISLTLLSPDGRFYGVSEHVRREKYGSLNATNTTEMMKTKMPSLNYGRMEVDFHSFDVQKSLNGGIDVLVTGYLTGTDNVSHAFSHSYFLAPKEVAGYFILNDMFRYMENNHHEGDQAPKTVLVPENNIPKQMAVPGVANILQDSLHLQIGKAFVERYYAMLHESPGLVYLFYKDLVNSVALRQMVP